MMKKIIFLIMILTVSACSFNDKNKPKTLNTEIIKKSLTELDNLVKRAIKDKKYNLAIEYLKAIDISFPYSRQARESKLILSDIYYQQGDTDNALMVIEDFIKYHGSSKFIKNAYYLKGLILYKNILNSQLEQKSTEKAKKWLKLILNKYPDIKEKKDIKEKIFAIDNHLAYKDLQTGIFNMKQGKFNGALNKFNNILVEYQNTKYAEEALHRIANIYYSLGIEKEAFNYLSVLKKNYPNSKWLFINNKTLVPIKK